MKILYHHRTRAEDAQGVHIQEMVRAFEELGHQVRVVALVDTPDQASKPQRRRWWEQLVSYLPAWFYEILSMLYNIYGYRKLCQFGRAWSADFIYERYSLNTFCGILASRRLGIPLVLEVNAPLYLEQRNLGKLAFWRFAKFSERWICSNSTITIVVSEVMKQILIDQGVSSKSIVVMPNGVSALEFSPSISGDPIRTRYQLEEKTIIGFVGWFRRWHGLEMLVEVFGQLRKVHPDLHLLFVGDGPAFEEIYHLAERLELLTDITFTGPILREEIPGHIAAMDIAVQPKATEYACPMKIIEYLAMGKCIVAPNQPNICEIIEDGYNGYLFTAGDQNDFARVLHMAIVHKDERQMVQRNALVTIEQKEYLWSANAKKVINLLDKYSKGKFKKAYPTRETKNSYQVDI